MIIIHIYSDHLVSKVFWQYYFYFSLCDILVFFIFYYCPLLPIIAHFGWKSIIAQPGFSRVFPGWENPGRAILPTLV